MKTSKQEKIEAAVKDEAADIAAMISSTPDGEGVSTYCAVQLLQITMAVVADCLGFDLSDEDLTEDERHTVMLEAERALREDLDLDTLHKLEPVSDDLKLPAQESDEDTDDEDEDEPTLDFDLSDVDDEDEI